MARSAESPTMTPGGAELVGLVRRYMSAVMDPFVSLLEVHKLTYFAQEAGEPVELKYANVNGGTFPS